MPVPTYRPRRSGSNATRSEVLSPAAEAGIASWQLANGWQRELDRALAPVALTHKQYLVLATLVRVQMENEDAVSQRAVARAAQLDEVTISRLMRGFEARGWVDRGPDGVDARAWRVIVTAAGNSAIREAHLIVQAASRDYFETLDAKRSSQRLVDYFRPLARSGKKSV